MIKVKLPAGCSSWELGTSFTMLLPGPRPWGTSVARVPDLLLPRPSTELLYMPLSILSLSGCVTLSRRLEKPNYVSKFCLLGCYAIWLKADKNLAKTSLNANSWSAIAGGMTSNAINSIRYVLRVAANSDLFCCCSAGPWPHFPGRLCRRASYLLSRHVFRAIK